MSKDNGLLHDVKKEIGKAKDYVEDVVDKVKLKHEEHKIERELKHSEKEIIREEKREEKEMIEDAKEAFSKKDE